MRRAGELSIFHLNPGFRRIHTRLPTYPETPSVPTMVWAGRHRQSTVGKGLFNDTDTDTVAVVTSPSSAVEISSNHVRVIFKHQSADSKDHLLSNSTLFGKIVKDAERHHCE